MQKGAVIEMKKVKVSVLIIACLILGLFVNTFAANDISGIYYAESCSQDGQTYECSREYLMLNEDGTGTVVFSDVEYPITWHCDGIEFGFVDSEGYKMTGSIDNGTIVGVYAGFNYVYKLDEKADVLSIPAQGISDMTAKEFYEMYGPYHTYSADNYISDGYESDYIHLNQDGTGIMVRCGCAYIIEWTINGNNLFIRDEMGYTMNGILQDGVISGSIDDLFYEMTICSQDASVKNLSPSSWANGLEYVTDQADILTSEEEASLMEQAAIISNASGCDVFIITVDDLRNYACTDSIETCADEIRAGYNLGSSKDGNILMLILSMAERDYTLMAHGDFANASFTDYGKNLLQDEFLDDFSENCWYDGFYDYLSTSEYYLNTSIEGDPIDVHGVSTPSDYRQPPIGEMIIGAVILGFIPAIIVTLIIRSRMKSVAKKTEANNYIVRDSINITHRVDRFTHMTQARVYDPPHQEKSSGGGGGTTTSHSGSSFSSGKF